MQEDAHAHPCRGRNTHSMVSHYFTDQHVIILQIVPTNAEKKNTSLKKNVSHTFVTTLRMHTTAYVRRRSLSISLLTAFKDVVHRFQFQLRVLSRLHGTRRPPALFFQLYVYFCCL